MTNTGKMKKKQKIGGNPFPEDDAVYEVGKIKDDGNKRYVIQKQTRSHIIDECIEVVRRSINVRLREDKEGLIEELSKLKP